MNNALAATLSCPEQMIKKGQLLYRDILGALSGKHGYFLPAKSPIQRECSFAGALAVWLFRFAVTLTSLPHEYIG
jgi:hypothetical protein